MHQINTIKQKLHFRKNMENQQWEFEVKKDYILFLQGKKSKFQIQMVFKAGYLIYPLVI